MAFNDPALLRDWKEAGTFPAIHDDIFAMAREHLSQDHGGVLDLCCSFGLLARRLHDLHVYHHVIGIDGDAKVIQMAKAAGITLPLYAVRIEKGIGADEVYHKIKQHNVKAIVARRAFPELFSEDHAFGREFIQKCREAGVQEWVIEGRVVSARSTNSLKSLEDELKLFSGVTVVHETRADNCAYLALR